jgi:AbrB family looped-hinge helix DNA binding protein
MTTATVTSKGQITIPANVRRALNVEAGDRPEFVSRWLLGGSRSLRSRGP